MSIMFGAVINFTIFFSFLLISIFLFHSFFSMLRLTFFVSIMFDMKKKVMNKAAVAVNSQLPTNNNKKYHTEWINCFGQQSIAADYLSGYWLNLLKAVYSIAVNFFTYTSFLPS